ncbi:hypothetical protein [Rubrivivax albus]|uniref:Uncharacterized protein n=1 Tax=Rubrivivax albus TaxID=2499835 RepID=A0A437JK63_9BURK|nr:hypothetical protein [Rubrivivax albus]RVT47044.1 hypothetical protein ENE75_24425 [Rubrivivax albus]
MSATLQKYLQSRGFSEVETQGLSTPGLKRKTYENGEFRLHLIRERDTETYAQVGPLGRPDEVIFLTGAVAYLTGDDSVTRKPISPEALLELHHTEIAEMFKRSPEGQVALAQYFDWQTQFAVREQARLCALAEEVQARRKPWWRLW